MNLSLLYLSIVEFFFCFICLIQMYVFTVSSQLLGYYIAQCYINHSHIAFDIVNKVDENDCSGQNDLVFKCFLLGSFTLQLDRKRNREKHFTFFVLFEFMR